MHPSCLPGAALLAECEIKRTKTGGPGGQHRNKVETAIVIRHQPTGICGQASERRSQEANREAALFRLRVNLAIEVRKPPMPKLSQLWCERTGQSGRSSGRGKISVNPNHDDFPCLLAEAMDRLAANGYEVGKTAQDLGVSTSQLVKFLKLAPAAFKKLNQERLAGGARPLK